MSFQTRSVIVVATLLRQLDNANPDVGMGYGDNFFIDRAAERLELTDHDFNRATVQAALKGKQ